MYRRSLKIVGVFLSALSLGACSVGMALSGKKDPDLSVLKKGAHRSEIEVQLGAPIQVVSSENGGSIAKYAYEIGNSPSAGRAAFHGAMDVLTLGVWEVVGTPVEAINGDKYQITITYDKDDHVVTISSPTK